MFSGLTGWHLLILSVVFLIPFLLAAVSIARDRAASGTAKAVWVLVILMFPLLGPLLWFVVGRSSARGSARPPA